MEQPIKKKLQPSNFVLWAAIAITVLCGKAQGQYCTNDFRYTEAQTFDTTEITVAANIQYGIAPDHLGNQDTLLMDLYFPNLVIDPSPKRPFIMLFHGGGFSSGDKASGDIRDLCIHLAMRGFVCASSNYRLGHDFSESGQYKARYRAIQDGHAAMRYVVNNANAARIDTAWMFIGGQSAGSLLALGMVYADPDELDSISLLYGGASISIELGNLYSSGNNLNNNYTFKGIFNNWGGITATEVDQEEMLPTIAFHGALDTIVKIDSDTSYLQYTLNGSRAIHQSLISQNTCSEISVDTLGGHGIYRNESSIFRAQRAACFFKSIFCNNCSNFYSTDSIPPTCAMPMSVSEEFHSSISIHPNPVDNFIQVDGIEGPLEIWIYNSQGQMVCKKEGLQKSFSIELASGFYYARIIETQTANPFGPRLLKK